MASLSGRLREHGLDFDEFAQVKRRGGDAAVIRLLTQAAQDGLPLATTMALAEKLELSPTFLAKVKALVSAIVAKRPAAAPVAASAVVPKAAPMMAEESTTTRMLRRSREPLDNWRLRRAAAKFARMETQNRASDEGFSHTVYEVRATHVETVLQLIDAYHGESFDYDADAHVLFWVRETDDEERLWLFAIDRIKGDISRIGGVVAPTDMPQRVCEEDFETMFPRAGAIDEVETHKFVDLLLGTARPLKVGEVLQ